jgi:ribose transport system substrate-binding protein
MGRLNWRSLALLAAAALLGALVLSACGGGGSSTSSSSSSSETGAETSETETETETGGETEPAADEEEAEGGESSGGLASAEKAVEEAKAPAQLNLPTEPIDMSKLKGKTVFYITPSLQIPFCAELTKEIEKAGKAAGVNVVGFDGKGKADVFNQGVEAAIAQGASGIILQAIDPSIVSGPLAKAKAAGIKVVDMFNRSPETPLDENVEAQVTLDYPQSGRTMANYIAADSGGKGKVGVVTWGIYEIYQEMVPAFEEELEKACPECELEAVKDVSPTGPATELQNVTTQMLRQYPEMDYVAPVSDALGMQMLPAVEAAGREVKIVTADGSIPALEALQEGPPMDAVVSDPPLPAVSWTALDQVARLMLGKEPSEQDSDLPTQMFTAGEVPEEAERWPGFEGFEEKFEELWGLK